MADYTEEDVRRLADAVRGMLENYLELERISLALARSDRPNWMPGMGPSDDIHVQRVTAALRPFQKKEEGDGK